MKKNYIQPVVDVTPVQAMGRVCAESFFQQMNIGLPTDPSGGR